jgi:hypothetical protein
MLTTSGHKAGKLIGFRAGERIAYFAEVLRILLK